jgi:hypothetical protein
MKMLKTSVIIVSFLSVINLVAQEYKPLQSRKLTLNCKDGCGATDASGNVIIPKKYSQIDYIDLGFYAVEDKHRKIIFNELGQLVLEIDSCEYLSNFINGIASFKVKDKFGFIDEKGNIIVQPKYDNHNNYSNDLTISYPINNYRYLDENGVVKIESKSSLHPKGFFSEGLAAVKLNNKMGFIDKTGSEVIPIIYDFVYNFSDGLALVGLNGIQSFIDKTGQVVFEMKVDCSTKSGTAKASGYFTEGIAPVFCNGKWGFIDKKGALIIPLKYNNASNFSNGLALVSLNNKSGFIDNSGKEIIAINYDYGWNFSDGLARMNNGGKLSKNLDVIKGTWIFINTNGEIVFSLTDVERVDDFIEGKAKVYSKKEGYYYIDQSGNRIK